MPKTIRIKNPPAAKSSTAMSKRVLFTVLGVIGGLFVGLAQLVVAILVIPTDETGSMSGWSIVAVLLTMFLLLASPITGGVLGYRKSTGTILTKYRQVGQIKIKRDDILAGAAKTPIIKRVTEDIFSRLQESEKNRSSKRKA
jgi:multisubunit Na+/H+ antiporter MnhG subunit